jgi:hypothetical protein
MKKMLSYFVAWMTVVLLSGAWLPARAQWSDADQQALRTEYTNKVLIFRNSFRMADRLEVNADGSVAGKHRPGFWSMDGACQVKNLDFGKDRVTFQCAKLWANVKDDGQLHYFPASAALKGKTDYPETMSIVFYLKAGNGSAAQLKDCVSKVFLGEKDSKLSATPAPIVLYIEKQTVEPDIDPAAAKEFDGTPPKAISTPAPRLSREAYLVGQAGRESFVALVDAEGRARVITFTHLLQYGLEETTMEAVKDWKFEPAMKDGKPVSTRIALSIDYKRPETK